MFTLSTTAASGLTVQNRGPQLTTSLPRCHAKRAFHCPRKMGLIGETGLERHGGKLMGTASKQRKGVMQSPLGAIFSRGHPEVRMEAAAEMFARNAKPLRHLGHGRLCRGAQYLGEL